MQLEHSFTVPVGVEQAWRVLLDIERIAPCMPGAAIDSVDGDDFTGTVKVKLGPIGLTYKGKAGFVEKDEAAHRAVIDARGRDARGNGTASAKVTATLTGTGDSTRVDVRTDLDITGKPAQFGRGVMVDVGNKLIGQFADCLAGKLTESDVPSAAERTGAPALAPTPAPEAGSAAAAAKAPAAAAAKAPAKKTAKAAPAKAAPAKKAAANKSVPAKAAKAEPAKAEPAKAAKAGPAKKAAKAAKKTAAAPAKKAAAASADVQPPHRPRPGPDPEPERPGAAPAARAARSIPQSEVEPINLIESAGPAIAKRLAPVALALVVFLLAVRRRGRRKRAR